MTFESHTAIQVEFVGWRGGADTDVARSKHSAVVVGSTGLRFDIEAVTVGGAVGVGAVDT